MFNPKNETKRLSKTILDMKFMQASRAKVAKEVEDEDGRSMYSTDIKPDMNHAKGNIVQDMSFLQCEEYIDYRLSFRGMNPDIEHMMAVDEQKRLGIASFDQPTEVSANEMADYYESTNSMKKKREAKKEYSPNKRHKKQHNND